MALYIIFMAIAAGWLCLWIFTFKTVNIKRFVVHTSVFVLLSALICLLAVKLVFLPVDESYSASNKGALGLLLLLFFAFFGTACLIALGVTLGKLLDRIKDDKAAKQNNADLITQRSEHKKETQ